MTLLVVGSIALDSVATPFGETEAGVRWDAVPVAHHAHTPGGTLRRAA
jgi:hypothetical protein